MSAIVLLVIIVGQAQAYELYPWKWPDADIPVPYYINTDNIPGSVTQADYLAAVHMGFSAWEAVPTSYIAFSHEGTGTAYTWGKDGHNTTGFTDLGAGGAVGLASIWSSGSDIVEVDIRLNTYQNWATNGAANADDVQGVLTHEIGHLLGMAHSDVPEATMWPYTWYGDTSRRTLEQDDILGVSALYWIPEPATIILVGAAVPFLLRRKSKSR